MQVIKHFLTFKLLSLILIVLQSMQFKCWAYKHSGVLYH